MLSGGESIDMGTIGSARPHPGPRRRRGAPGRAGRVQVADQPRRGAQQRPDDEDLLALLGGGDLRDQARNLAMTTPASELLNAFQLAAGLPGWADGACAAVEREIAAGQLGDATREWITSAFRINRLLMAEALRGRGFPARPARPPPPWC